MQPTKADCKLTHCEAGKPGGLAKPYTYIYCWAALSIRKEKKFMQEYYLGLDHWHGFRRLGRLQTCNTKSSRRMARRCGRTRLFPEANTAADRRANRIARRRIERREQRIALIAGYFRPAVAAVDPAFFQRLDESKFLEADKRPDGSGAPLGKYALFADGAIATAIITGNSPPSTTCGGCCSWRIAHSTCAWCTSPRHHILKKRGHFLFGRFGARGRDL